MKRVCLFGGSFNPPHIGHVLASAWAVRTLPIDVVWWMPTYQHAFGKDLARYDTRTALCEAAIQGIDGIEVSHVERELGGESRTIDTLTHLRAAHKDHEFSLLIGSDILAETHAWKNWDAIERSTKIHVLGRAGFSPESASYAITMPQVSSTELRIALEAGDEAMCMPRLPREVFEIIRREELYGWSESGYREAQRAASASAEPTPTS